MELEFQKSGDGSHTLFRPDINETYHSHHGAIQESVHVFIQEGIAFQQKALEKKQLSVFEVGYGTGLNALLSHVYAKENGLELYYETVELYPLAEEVWSQLNYPNLLGYEDGAAIFAKHHQSNWNEKISFDDSFQMQKLNGDLIQVEINSGIDIVFFDAFAPNKQAEMWEVPVFKKLFNHLNVNGILVTYCANGQFKRNLREAGFLVDSIPGPPGKREMVRGVKLEV
jgi:tRNA U34 5-methylaminomethyl-2-thiouridine-forming methyltransferase MnmC